MGARASAGVRGLVEGSRPRERLALHRRRCSLHHAHALPLTSRALATNCRASHQPPASTRLSGTSTLWAAAPSPSTSSPGVCVCARVLAYVLAISPYIISIRRCVCAHACPCKCMRVCSPPRSTSSAGVSERESARARTHARSRKCMHACMLTPSLYFIMGSWFQVAKAQIDKIVGKVCPPPPRLPAPPV